MPIVLISPNNMANRPDRPYVKMLEEAGFEVRYPTNPELVTGLCSDEETVSALSGISAIVAGGENFNANVLSSLPEMRVIARAGVGFDRVDVPAATERTIAVTITPTANHEAVAEQALTLLLCRCQGHCVEGRRRPSGRVAEAASKAGSRKNPGDPGIGAASAEVWPFVRPA